MNTLNRGLAVLVVAGLALGCGGAKKAEMAKAFAGKLDAFIELELDYSKGAECKGQKVVAVDMTEGKLHEAHFTIPDAVRAKTPDEVEFVAQVTRHRRDAGKYSDGSSAVALVDDVWILDINTGAPASASTKFKGRVPGFAGGSSDGPRVGLPPTPERISKHIAEACGYRPGS